jgi:hypothetical protein
MGILVCVIATAIAGAGLVRIGWRGRRVGDERRCPACGYNLAGLPLPRCPECGTGFRIDLAPGRWQRRRLPLAGGLACLLLAGLMLPAAWLAVRHDLFTRYYSLWPGGLLIRDIDSPRRVRAIAQLTDRYAKRGLSEGQTAAFRKRLADMLARAPAGQLGPLDVLQPLADMIRDGRLSDSERELFFRRLSISRVQWDRRSGYLHLFPKNPVPDSPPFNRWYFDCRLSVLALDGQPAAGLDGQNLAGLPYPGPISIPLQAVPTRSLRLRLRIDVYACPTEAPGVVASGRSRDGLTTTGPELMRAREAGRRLWAASEELTLTAPGGWQASIPQ